MSVMGRRLPAIVLTLLCSVPGLAFAAARAWVQPDRVALGESTTLNVEAEDAASAPDFSVLEADFAMQGQSSTIQTTQVNGRVVRQALFGVVLVPRRAGTLTIPALKVGADTTAPVTLTVTPAVQGSAARGDLMYMETALANEQPYVQQPVRYTVRLYYAISLINGDVEVPAPEGATLQQTGKDTTRQQTINGRRYNVFERNFLLTPEKSGTLELAAPRFVGRARTSNFDSFFDGGQVVSSTGEARSVTVLPQPPGAPQPWLPAVRVELHRPDPAQVPRAGEPLTLTIELRAEGAIASQLPELQLPRIEGAQVFPEAAQRDESLEGAVPVAGIKRRFAIVPSRPGPLTLPELRVPYWNVVTDRADAAVLPAMQWVVEPATVASALLPEAEAGATVEPGAPAVAGSTAPAPPAALRAWQAATAVLFLALLAALEWGRRRGVVAAATSSSAAAVAALPSPKSLQRALAAGELPAIARALRGLTHPRSATLGEVQARLADGAQRAAIEALQRVLWSPTGDAAAQEAVLMRLRNAFARGVQVKPRTRAAAAAAELPPLYPQRDREAG